jgi:hypothetical protein
MSKGKHGEFNGHNAKTGTHRQIPSAPQARPPGAAPVLRIEPRGKKAGAKGR